MKDLINYSDFTKIEIRLGTIISVELNSKLRNPSYILKIDFGQEIGIKKSSAQLRKNYKCSDLINKQVIAVINFKPKQIGKIISEVLVLALPDNESEAILLLPQIKLENGVKLY